MPGPDTPQKVRQGDEQMTGKQDFVPKTFTCDRYTLSSMIGAFLTGYDLNHEFHVETGLGEIRISHRPLLPRHARVPAGEKEEK